MPKRAKTPSARRKPAAKPAGAPTRPQDHVFVSYSSIDCEFALRLSADLRNRGVKVWMDRLDRGIAPGDEWAEVLDAALKECAAAIAVISPDYLSSVYCRDEVEYAFRTKRRVYPVRLRLTDDGSRPFWMDGLQFVDFSRWRDPAAYGVSLETLVTAIGHNSPEQLRAPPDPEAQYLNRLSSDLQGRRGVTSFVPLQAEGEIERPPVPTEDEFGFAFLRPKAVAPAANQRRTTRGELDDLVDRHRRCVLVGDPGAGKTTALRWLALRAAARRQREGRNAPLPLVIYLAEWTDGTIEELIQHHWPFAPDPGPLLAAGEIVVFLDGLNEMGGKTKANVEQLRSWLAGARGPALALFTCRRADHSNEISLGLPVVTLEPLGAKEIDAYSRAYLGPKADAFSNAVDRGGLSRFATNPYFLGALTYLYEQSPLGELPRNRGLLLQKLTASLWERERLRQTAGWAPFPQLVETLGRLAHEMMIRRESSFAPAVLAGEEPALDALASAQLVEPRGSTVTFSHPLLHEFFVAAWLDLRDPVAGCRTFLDATRPDHGGRHWYWNDKVWQPLMSDQRGVLSSLLGLSGGFDAIITWLASEHPDVAAQCAYDADAELRLAGEQLDRIAEGLRRQARYWGDQSISYGLSSYDGDPEQLMATYGAGDAENHYLRAADAFVEWRKRESRLRPA